MQIVVRRLGRCASCNAAQQLAEQDVVFCRCPTGHLPADLPPPHDMFELIGQWGGWGGGTIPTQVIAVLSWTGRMRHSLVPGACDHSSLSSPSSERVHHSPSSHLSSSPPPPHLQQLLYHYTSTSVVIKCVQCSVVQHWGGSVCVSLTQRTTLGTEQRSLARFTNLLKNVFRSRWRDDSGTTTRHWFLHQKAIGVLRLHTDVQFLCSLLQKPLSPC